MHAKPSSKKPPVRKKKEADLPTPGPFSERQIWTREDHRVLRLYYPTKGAVWLARKLGRTPEAVQTRAGRIGLKYEGQRQWTKKELTYLCGNFHKQSVREIAGNLNRTIGSVAGQIWKLRDEIERDPAFPYKLQPKPRHREWTEKQLNFIRRNYGSLTPTEIAARLGMDARRVGRKAYSLGLTTNPSTNARNGKHKELLTETQKDYILRNMVRLDSVEIARHLHLPHSRVLKFVRYYGEGNDRVPRLWTPNEIEFVRSNFGTMLIKDIARKIGRTPDATMRKAKKLGLSMEKGFYDTSRRWTTQEDRLLRKLYSITTMPEIAERLGRTVASVREHVRHTGLSQTGNNYFKQKHRWTKEENDILRKLYPTRSAREIAELLGRTRASVNAHVRVLQLTGKKK